MLYIIDGGLQTLVQDIGRKGYYHLGVPPSGAGDQYSYILGNVLLGNPSDYSALEITLLGPIIEVRKQTVIAITGAPVDATLNDSPIPMWEIILVKTGDILKLKAVSSGVKSYLCVSGGINVPDILGSKSTYLLNHMGGYKGRKLKNGDEVLIGEPLPGVFHHIGKRIPKEYIPAFPFTSDIRVVLGLSSYRLSDVGIKSFLDSEWRVEIESNNMAYRYTGGTNVTFEPFEPSIGTGTQSPNVIDMVYPIGAIIIPNEAELILLLKDATTGGGFVTIGTTINVDLDLVAQSRPNKLTHFRTVTVEQAIEARLKRKRRISELRDFLK